MQTPNAVAVVVVFSQMVQHIQSVPPVLEKQQSANGVSELCYQANGQKTLDGLVPLDGGSRNTDNEIFPIRFKLDCTKQRIKSCRFAHSWAEPSLVNLDNCGANGKSMQFMYQARGDMKTVEYALKCSSAGGCWVSRKDKKSSEDLVLVPVQNFASDTPVLDKQTFGNDGGFEQLCKAANRKESLTALVPIGGGAPSDDKENVPISFKLDCAKKFIKSCSFGPITNEYCGKSQRFFYKGKADKEGKTYGLRCSPLGGCFVDPNL